MSREEVFSGDSREGMSPERRSPTRTQRRNAAKNKARESEEVLSTVLGLPVQGGFPDEQHNVGNHGGPRRSNRVGSTQGKGAL